MKNIVIIGAGGFAREVAWLIEDINKKNKEWNFLGYIDDNKELLGKELNGYKVLGDTDYLNSMDKDIYTVIAIGDGKIRERIVNKLNERKFATLIHPNVSMSKYINIGEGTIICSSNILTVNIEIGKHVIINLDCTVGHDDVLDDFITIMPSVNISGEVNIGKRTMIGTGTAIIQGKIIGRDVVVGAGSVVIRDIENNCTVVGNPARVIKR